jgi:hypothetical protein
MQNDAGSCSPKQFLQKAFVRRALIAVSATAAILVALASTALDIEGRDTFRVTVIYKNQVHPRFSEPEAGGWALDLKGEANGGKGLVFQRRGQWI